MSADVCLRSYRTPAAGVEVQSNADAMRTASDWLSDAPAAALRSARLPWLNTTVYGKVTSSCREALYSSSGTIFGDVIWKYPLNPPACAIVESMDIVSE